MFRKKQEKSQKPVVFYVVIWSVWIIIPGVGASGLLKFDFCMFLGDIKGDLGRPYITITGE